MNFSARTSMMRGLAGRIGGPRLFIVAADPVLFGGPGAEIELLSGI
ncbi:hypothetical protein [Paraburkholderia humisilvae]|nr:hypothetical protein [Paraburkholderia humisilvae]